MKLGVCPFASMTSRLASYKNGKHDRLNIRSIEHQVFFRCKILVVLSRRVKAASCFSIGMWSSKLTMNSIENAFN